MEFDANPNYPDKDGNHDQLAFLVMKMENANNTAFKENVCTKEKGNIYNYEVIYYK